MDTLTRMRAFIAVVDNEGFSAAARKTGRSKALLSKYVRELEDELGVLLINRTTRQVALTASGEVYRARAAAILADLEALNEEAREATGAVRGTIRLSVARTFADSHFGQSLVDFALAQPGIALDMHLDDAFVDVVEEGFDVAIRMTRLTDSALIARRLGSLQFVLCASPALLDHHAAPTHPGELAGLPVIVDSNMRALNNWSFADPQTGQAITVAVTSRFVANSPIAVRKAARAGLGFALLPEFIVRTDLERGRLRTILSAYMPAAAGIYAVFPHRRHLPARTRVFVDHLASWFRKNELAGGERDRIDPA